MILRYPMIILIYLIPAILVSLTVHELSHAYVSYRLGDPTAKDMGRLTLNPLKHLDVLGTIMLLVSSFGWAKPVPINPMYYTDRRKGTIMVSLAGPLSNIVLAFIFAVPRLYIGQKYGIPQNFQFINSWEPEAVLFNMGAIFFTINIGLASFNLLPFPPLDGSKILSSVLRGRHYYKFLQYENLITLGFLLMVFAFPGALGRIMTPITWTITTVINSVLNPLINAII